jgi:hypothetical protein
MTDQTRYPTQRGNGSTRARSEFEGRPPRRAEDPLAELARLIGQDDPFADMAAEPHQPARSHATPVARRPSNGTPPRAPRREDPYEDDDRYEPVTDEYDRQPERVQARQYDDEADYEYEAPKRPRMPAPQTNGRAAYPYGEMPAPRAEQPAARAARPAAARRPPVSDFEDDYEPDYDRHNGNGHDASYRGARGYQDQPEAESRAYGQDYSSDYDAEYAPDEYAQEEEYAQVPRNKRRWMLIGIMSLIGVVVLGVASLYGYRAVFKRHAKTNPPTIHSAETPTKVVPNSAADGSKQNYDRLTEQPGGGERVVSREEQPAAFNAPSGGRVVTTTPQPAGSVSAFAAPGGQMGGAPVLNPPAGNIGRANGEPKRVRTMTVRSDGSVVENGSHRSEASRSVNAPLALNPNAQSEPAESEPAPQPPVRTATHPSAQQPWAGAEPARRQQSNYTPAGSYVVQVSSQKSENDAHTAWRQLQAKYTNVLGNAQVSFKRVDLGDRGTFYRAMVGPFGNRDQAYEMCQNLKSAGGECVVQRN